MTRQATAHIGLLRLGGVSACIASLVFALTVVHILIILPIFGFDMAMLDDRSLLLPWMADHRVAYGLLWQLYFATQMFLLPVPLALYAFATRTAHERLNSAAAFAIVGTAATTMAMVGAVVVYSTSPLVAHAYLEASASSQAYTLLLGDLFADLGKELRLFSELLLGIWLASTGIILLRQNQTSRLIWLPILVGLYTCGVAIVKIFNPLNPLEDTLGFLLAIAYACVGWLLVRESTALVPPAPPL